ncbi:ABC transporter substrate-binding protein [Nocardioides sp. Leaf374]|uniref:ABC transporter substrate-binding protein n=1 Tax=Nocardioides sp. Leaf374 TaxID=2876560 RepID=UPI001E352749|nr:ABC transporter substrate-binding protein [Nocardioides sp. Leaf374]
MPRPRGSALTASVLTASVLALAGCGTSTDASGSASGGEPVTVANCGSDVTFPSAPERVVMLKSAAVPYLHDLGVLDRVVARAGLYPSEYYDEQTLAELDVIPELTSDTDAGGHLQISKEVVVAQRPDLVLGEVDNLSRSSLEAVDVPLLEEPALCETGGSEPGFDDVWSQLALYGEVFDRPDEAAAATADLQERLAAVEAEVDGPSGRTAAVLYPTVGGGTTYAYGTGSMAHPQLEAAGFENVFGDVDERVVEVTLEELLGRDPDVIVLLHTDGDPADVEEALVDLPGAERLTAVREGEVMTQLFNFTEPPSPLAVDGLEAIVARFGE